MAMGSCDATKCKKRRWEQGGRDRVPRANRG